MCLRIIIEGPKTPEGPYSGCVFFSVFSNRDLFRVCSNKVLIRFPNYKAFLSVLSDRILFKIISDWVVFRFLCDREFFKLVSDRVAFGV